MIRIYDISELDKIIHDSCKNVYIDVDNTLFVGYLAKHIIKNSLKYMGVKDKVLVYAINFLYKLLGLNNLVIKYGILLSGKYAKSIDKGLLEKLFRRNLEVELIEVCKRKNCYLFSQEHKEVLNAVKRFLEEKGINIQGVIGSDNKRLFYSFEDKIRTINDGCVLDDYISLKRFK